MAQTIKLKRSATPGGIPTTSALALGEVAINTADGKMYIKKDVGGTESIVEIGSGGGGSSLDVIWKQYVYTAGVSQTVFTGADDNSDILAYAVNFIEVFLNGILLDPSVDFTATDTTSIVFTEAPATGDLIQIDTFAKSVGIGDILLNSFTGDNSTTIFTLSDAPGAENNTSVFIGGVYQNKTTYSVSGTSLTFSEAPATNAEIEVVIGSRNVSLTDIADLSISGVLTASGGNSTNWNTAYGWGDHSTAGYLPLTGGTLSGSLSLGFNDITSVGTITATQFSGELFGNVTGNVLGNVTGDVTGSAGTVTSLAGHTTTELTEGTNLYYTDARADARVALIVDSAPATLDTLNELAAALGDDPNFATTTATAIGLKAPLDSPTFTGPVVFNSTGSIKVPVGTTAERDAIPTSGMFRYNSSEAQFEGYQDGSWGAIGGGGGGSNTFTTDSFIGDGSTTDYVLSQTVSSEDNLLVFIEGVFQQQDAYSIATVSGVTTLTFTVAPIDTRDIIIYSVAGAVSGSNLNIDTMIGDNSTIDLILSIAPINENNTQVFLDGVYQNKSTYSISGTTLTFSTAPPTDTEVEVMTFTQTDINVPVDNTITTAKLVDGSVTSAKLDTNIAVAGTITASGEIAANGGIALGDNDKATFGAGDDLQIYHDGFNTIIAESGAGSLIVRGDNTYFSNSAGTKSYADFIADGAVILRNNNLQKLATTATGIDVTGAATFSGDVGIGTSSPSFLGFGSSTGGIDIVNSNNAALRLSGNAADAMFFVSGSGQHWLYGKGAVPMTFSTNGTERMRIDASGKLLVGTTAAIGTNVTGKVQILGGETYITTNNEVAGYVGLNSNADNSLALMADPDNLRAGSHIAFYVDGIVERMRLDTSGNLLVGTTSKYNGYPSRFLTQSIATSSAEESCPILELVGNRTAGVGNQNAMIQFWNKTSTATEVGRISSIQGSAVNTGELDFATASAGTLTSRMLLDANGNLYVGGTDLAYDGTKLITGSYSATSAGLSILCSSSGAGYLLFGDGTGTAGYSGQINYNHSQNRMGFNTNNVEYMAINSVGDLLLNTAVPLVSGKQSLLFNGSTHNGLVLKTTRVALNSTFAAFINVSGSICGSIIQNGTTSVNYAASSDRRLKENISDSDDSGSVIDAIQVRKFDWIGTDEHERYGFIAQELQEVVPVAVCSIGMPDEEDPMLGVDPSKLMALAIKEIQSLRARIAILEGA